LVILSYPRPRIRKGRDIENAGACKENRKALWAKTRPLQPGVRLERE